MSLRTRRNVRSPSTSAAGETANRHFHPEEIELPTFVSGGLNSNPCGWVSKFSFFSDLSGYPRMALSRKMLRFEGFRPTGVSGCPASPIRPM